MNSMESQLSTSKEKIIITWFNDPTMGDRNYIQSIKERLEDIASILSSFDDDDECIDFINDVKDHRIILILGPSTGAQVLRNVLCVSQLKAVFIVCPNQSMRPPWATECKSIRCITVDLTSICQQIEILIEENIVGIDILDSPITLANQNKQDVRFMYSQLVKYVLTETVYSNDDTNDMIEFFENKFVHDPVTMNLIRTFADNYESSRAIWYYTSQAFLYKTLNSALRTLDICALYSMRVFLKDLHLQIVRLHTIKQITQSLKLYRGLVISTEEFEKMKQKIGKLLSFSSFLSTSTNINVALMFSDSSSLDEAAILFEITIDPSMSTSVAFSSIQELSQYADEAEHLFTMGSIFRLESIKHLDGSPNWCAHLTLATDQDPETVELTKYMQLELNPPNIFSLHILLTYMGQYNELLDILNAQIKSCKDETDLCHLYMMLGIIYMEIENIQSASDTFQLFYEHFRRFPESQYATFVSYNLVTCLDNILHNKFDLALTNIETMKTNIHEYFDTEDNKHITFFSMLEAMKGFILERQGRYADALECHTESYHILGKNLPSTHPLKFASLFGIIRNYCVRGQLDNAYLCLQQATHIQSHSVPQEDYLAGFLQDIKELLEPGTHANLQSDYSNVNLSDYKKDPKKLYMLCAHLTVTDKCDEALLAIDRYIQLSKENSIIQDAQLATVYFFRGFCHETKENLTEALQDLKTSYEIGIQYFDKTHFAILCILGLTAVVHAKLDHYDQAINIIEQYEEFIHTNPELSSAAKKKSLFEPLLEAFESRAVEQTNNKNYDKALLAFTNLLKIKIYVLPADHVQVGETYQSIAEICCQTENYNDALYNYTKALNIFEKYLNSNDPQIVDIWDAMRNLYYQLEQYNEALFACIKYLKFQENTSPLDYIKIGNSYSEIAKIYVMQENYSDAIENYDRALAIQLEHLPETCFETIQTLNDLGNAYLQLNQYEKSLVIFYESLEYQLNVLPPDHIDVLPTYKVIAVIQGILERYEEAFENFEACLCIQINVLPSDHLDIAETQECLGEMAVELKKLSLAASYFERVLEIRQKHLPDFKIEVMNTWKLLGHIYDELERYDDSERAFYEYECFKLSISS